jgi:branched-chain amino acid transport system permease protein
MKEEYMVEDGSLKVGKLLSAKFVTIAIFLLIALLTGFDKGPYVIVNAIVTGAIYSLMAMGLALVFGVMNIPMFAHGEFFMVGTLVAYYIFTPLNKYLVENPNSLAKAILPLSVMFAAAVVGAIVGIIVEITVFKQLRKRSREEWVLNTFLITLGLSILLINCHQLIFGANLKGIVQYWDFPPFNIFDVYVSVDRIVCLLIALSCMASLGIFMKYTRTGQAIRAVSQDEAGAHLIGVNPNNIYVLTLSLSCAIAALAGASVLFMYPSFPMVGFQPLYMSWFVVIIVGLGNISGCLIGGFIVAFIQVLTTSYIGEGWDFVLPAILICLVLVVKPSGIFGTGVKFSVHER